MIKKVIVIILSLMVVSGCEKKPVVVDNTSKAETIFLENQTVDNMLIENFNIGYDTDGWFIAGDVKNILKTSRYITSIQIKLFDKDNNLIADTYFYIARDIQAEETLIMNLLVKGDLSSVTRAEFAVV